MYIIKKATIIIVDDISRFKQCDISKSLLVYQWMSSEKTARVNIFHFLVIFRLLANVHVVFSSDIFWLPFSCNKHTTTPTMIMLSYNNFIATVKSNPQNLKSNPSVNLTHCGPVTTFSVPNASVHHYIFKTSVRQSYLYQGNSCAGKMSLQ